MIRRKVLMSLAAGLAVLATAYGLKSRSGIDMDPQSHLIDYVFHPLAAWAQFSEPAPETDRSAKQTPAPTEIIVDVGKVEGPVNRHVLGVNILGIKSSQQPNNTYSAFAGGLWDAKAKTFVQEPLSLARAIGVSTLRFPGGCGTHSYDWKRTIGKDRLEFQFGLEEFVRLAQELNAEPVITLSYFTGGPQDAADMVEFLNAPSDEKHPWAMKRSDPAYGVKYFELGNEVDHGDHKQIRSVTPEKYASDFLKYYEAIKAVDPKSQVGAVLYKDPWNENVLKIIGDKIDFVIVHIYPTPSWGKELESLPVQEIFAVSLALPVLETVEELQKLKGQMKRLSGREVPVFVTEYNGGFAQDKPVPYRHSLGNALVNAELVRIFMDPKNNVAFAHQWNFLNEYWGMIANGFKGLSQDLNDPYIKRPNYYVFELYRKHFGDQLVASQVYSLTYDAGEYEYFQDKVRKNPDGQSIGDPLLGPEWEIYSVDGIAARQDRGELSLNFGDHRQTDYYHSLKFAKVKPDTFYQLSGEIQTMDLTSDQGIGLEIQDARGKANSAAATQKVSGNSSWTHIRTVYRTLPDTHTVKIFARHWSQSRPLKGQAVFKNVQLQEIKPDISLDVPYLSVNASKSSDGRKIYLMVINKDPSASQEAVIDLQGFVPAGQGMAWTLNGASMDVTNEKDHQNIAIREAAFAINANGFHFTFEPHSVTAIEVGERM